MAKLSLKQQKFCEVYIETGNAYQSAIEAGYSENYAKGNVIKLLENERVKAFIDARMDELKQKSIATQEEVLQALTSILRGETVDLTDAESEQFGKTTTRAIRNQDRVKAAELLGKRYQMWTDKVDLSGGVEVVVIKEDLDDE